jgi:hypothetical protein
MFSLFAYIVKPMRGEFYMHCNNIKSRILSGLMTIIMIISLLPVTAFAADPPILIDAAVTADGGVGLTFSKEMSPEGLVEKVKAGFAIVGENGAVTITNVTLHSASGGTNNFVQLYLSPAIKGGEVSSLSYTPGEV